MNFTGKVVIVTGASSGIGAVTAVEFAKLGASVVLVARNKSKLKSVQEKCEKSGRKILVLIAELSDEQQARSVVKDTINEFGRIDILINNAGFAIPNSFLDENVVDSYDKVHAVNLRAVIVLTHEAIPHLIKSKGNIINISSVAALTSIQHFWAYCTTKVGLDHFTRCIAGELGPQGVRVNTVNPGPVKTDFAENMGSTNPKEIYENAKVKTALNRVSEASEIADLIVFLASDKARAVTGSSWVSDDGYLVKQG